MLSVKKCDTKHNTNLWRWNDVWHWHHNPDRITPNSGRSSDFCTGSLLNRILSFYLSLCLWIVTCSIRPKMYPCQRRNPGFDELDNMANESCDCSSSVVMRVWGEGKWPVIIFISPVGSVDHGWVKSTTPFIEPLGLDRSLGTKAIILEQVRPLH